MHELDNAIKAFAAGQLDYAGLLKVLGGTLRGDPAAVPAAIERLNAALEAGELPPPVHADFLKRIEQFRKANAASAPSPKAPPPAAPTDSEASAARQETPPPAAPADEEDAAGGALRQLYGEDIADLVGPLISEEGTRAGSPQRIRAAVD